MNANFYKLVADYSDETINKLMERGARAARDGDSARVERVMEALAAIADLRRHAMGLDTMLSEVN